MKCLWPNKRLNLETKKTLIMKFKYLVALFFLLSFLSGISVAQTADSKELRIGWISQFPVQDMKSLQPLADYLEKKLKAMGFTKVRIVISGSIHSMAHLIDRDKVDIFFDSVLPTLGVHQITHMDFLLRQWKNGIKEYHSVIFVNKDDPAKDLQDLGGYALAMVKPYSTSGYLVPRYFLEQKGMSLKRMMDESENHLQG